MTDRYPNICTQFDISLSSRELSKNTRDDNEILSDKERQESLIQTAKMARHYLETHNCIHMNNPKEPEPEPEPNPESIKIVSGDDDEMSTEHRSTQGVYIFIYFH